MLYDDVLCLVTKIITRKLTRTLILLCHVIFSGSKEKALQQKYRTIKKVEYLCAESKMDEGVNESITIRVTFKGPTPSNGPMDTIQKLFSAKSITPNSVVLRRGRPPDATLA